MKKANSIAMVIVALLMAWGSAYCSEEKHARNMDGNDWTGFSKSYKMGFVLGFFAIHDILMRKAKEINDFIDQVLPDLCPEKFQSRKEQLLWLQFKFRFPVEEFELEETTPQQIFDGLETFYKDHLNRNIKIVIS